jgi:hypothetical protein
MVPRTMKSLMADAQGLLRLEADWVTLRGDDLVVYRVAPPAPDGQIVARMIRAEQERLASKETEN